MLFIHGRKSVDIGIDELLIECPSCEAHNFADVLVTSIYYHFYWLPFVPIGKEASIACKKCGLKRMGLPFDSRPFANHPDIKSKFKHPMVAYSGISLVSIIVVYFIIDSLSRHS